MTAQYPLTWPDLIPRHKTREAGRFKMTLPASIANVEHSLRRFGADSGKAAKNLVISSNYTLTERRPADPGVAVWFVWDEIQVCIPIDRYTTIEANLQAIHHVLEARRVEIRHGTLALVRASFRGLLAIAPPTGSSWREILGFKPGDHVIALNVNARYRELAKNSGNEQRLAELNVARDAALKELAP
ncbi:J domain-containing protein [Mesorhizobium neociceri]|uniref:J domain-containing protein n=1 Tax=Mesorhizobium neociceri TaxID=1307853 RepID=A0A838AXY6_9HYPH|nr:J domain-containing protein [Mesorhizobium neociceri]MBA1139306.1 J domain-containing protein [Mesorhizobium neociceri]